MTKIINGLTEEQERKFHEDVNRMFTDEMVENLYKAIMKYTRDTPEKFVEEDEKDLK